MKRQHSNRLVGWVFAYLFCTSCVHAFIVSESFSFNAIGGVVPDGTGTGLVNVQNVSSTISTITDVTLDLHLAGGPPGFNGINGDLYAYVQHASGFAVLLNRPGMTGTAPLGYFDAGGFNVSFNDAGVNGNAHFYRVPPGPGIPPANVPVAGTFQPDGRNIDSMTNPPAAVGAAPVTATLASLNTLDASGAWTLYVEDMFGSGSNFTLQNWALHVTGDNGLAIPEPNTSIPFLALLATALLYRRRVRVSSDAGC